MTELIKQIREKINEKTGVNELKTLYEEFVKSDQAKKGFQAELRNIFKSTGFDKQKFVSELLKDKSSTAIFQFDQKYKGSYNKNLDGAAGDKSQTKKLAEKTFVELINNEIGTDKKESFEYISLDKIAKQKLINLGLSSGKTLEQLGAKNAIILEGDFDTNKDGYKKAIRLSYLNPQDVLSINTEIRDNRLLSKNEAQNYLDAKTGGKYILCHDCRKVEQYTDEDKYDLSTKENSQISAEDFKKLPLGIERGLTIKSLRVFIDSATKKFPQLKDSKNVLLGSNKYDWYKGSPEIVSIIADPKDGGEPKKIFKLDISSLVPTTEVTTHYV